MINTVDSCRANPFPGLRPFRSDEHHLFFGREQQTTALLQLLRTNRFLAVVGTSGSGKSSLVRAGMIAELHGGTMTQAGSTWEVMILRPGGSPLENLARAFVDADLYDRDDPSTLPRLIATLNRSRFGLVEAMKQSAACKAGANLLVVVDQFEELFRFRQQGIDSEETAAAFVNLLLTASEQVECPIYVAITMRSDYLGDCSAIPGLAEAVNEGEYLIPRLLRDQKRDAIEKPIGVGGAKISPLLVQRLLNEVGDDPDQLPVLQHALMRMWDAWSAGAKPSRPIDFVDFEATGGLASALSNHADEIYESLPDDRHRLACEKIFKTLTEKGTDNRGIRRPTRLAKLQAIAAADRGTVTTVLDAFRGSGVTFLMPGTEVELVDRTILDLSHESLMRGWQRLCGWVEAEAQSARIFRRLLDTARLWSDGKAGLFRDPDLQVALSSREQESPNGEWAEQYGGDFPTAMGFLETSNAQTQSERQAKEAARQRELDQARQLAEARQLRLEHQQRAARKLRTMVVGLAAVAVIAGAACVAALLANRRANRLADDARESARNAEQSQRETACALDIVASQKSEVEGSLSKAETAEQQARAAEDSSRKLLYTTDMRLAPFLWADDRTTAEQLRGLLAKHIPDSSDENEAEIAKSDLRGFEWRYYQHLVDHSALVFSGHPAPVVGSALTANGQLATLDRNGQVRRWDLDSQDEDEASRLDLPGGQSTQLRVLSPNGRLAALAEGNKVHVFDASTGKQTFEVDSVNVAPRHLLFSRDNDRLIIVDRRIRWFNAASGKAIASFNQTFDRIESLALSADGLTLAVAGHGSFGNLFSIFRLNAAGRTVTQVISDVFAGSTLGASALSPDGKRIAVGGRLAGFLSVFETDTGRMLVQRTFAHATGILALAFSDDGARLASADAGGTIKIWADAQKLNAKNAVLLTLKGHAGAINTVCFSPDGKRLVTTGADKTARIWDLENARAAVRPLERCGSSMMTCFSPDGQLVAAANGGNSVRLWDAATGQCVRLLPPSDKGRVCSVAFSPVDYRLLAVGYGGQADVSYVSLWDIDSGTELARLPGATDLPNFPLNANTGAVGALAFSPDGKYLVAGFGTKYMLTSASIPTPLKVWEVATRRPVCRLKGHTGYCVSLDFSRDGTHLASGSRDGTAIIWSTRSWTATRTLLNPDTGDSQFSQSPRGMVDNVAFTPDGKALAMASRMGNVHLWDVDTGKLLKTLEGHSSAVTAVVFSPDGRTLASGGSDHTVRLWNVDTRRELMQLDPGTIDLGAVNTLAFSPDGNQLLAGGTDTVVWSAAPIIWNDPDRSAEKLKTLLGSNADFRSRIRMLSENLRLYETLEKLDAKQDRVRAALAATKANWHASRQAWSQAVLAFDRLKAADPAAPADWLRMPGLLRLATTLLNQDRPVEAAILLEGGAGRRAQDGIAPSLNLIRLFRRGDIADELLSTLQTSLAKRLVNEPRDAGLLELRAELVGQQSDFAKQAADYTTAIAILAERPGEAAGQLPRLYRRRGDAYISLKEWSKAVDDYAQVITPETADVELLSNRALAQEGLKDWDAAAADWSRVATANPQGATLLAEFARRLVANGQAPLATRQFEKSQALYEHLREAVPQSESLAAELAQVLLDRLGNERLAADRERLRLAAVSLASPWAKLAAAYHLGGDQQALESLLRDQPAAAAGLGDLHAAAGDWNAAIAEYRKVIAVQPTDDSVLTRLAAACQSAGRTREAVPYLAELSAANPKDTLLSLKVAALQAWFGQDKELAATRQRVLAFAKDSIDAQTANRAAKACCIVPLTDPAELELALNLARTGVSAGKGTRWWHWDLLALGMAQYRNGNAAAAAEALLAAAREGSNEPQVVHASAFYRAMCLFRQGKADEARKLVAAAAVTMKPLPVDENNPLVNNVNHDDLNMWLAFKEAKALLKIGLSPLGLLEQAREDQVKTLGMDDPTTIDTTNRLIDAYLASGRTRQAVPLFTDLSAARPADTVLLLEVAAVQAWFGRPKELAATQQRILAAAKDTNNPDTADRAAKACMLVPTDDKRLIDAALALGQRSVKVGMGGEWHLLALGMAEYRNGNYSAAAEALAGVPGSKAGANHARAVGTAAFYRAMSLFRLGKRDEAQKLASEAAAQMRPLPKDENNPITSQDAHNDLVLWLAYKEAKALIKFDMAAVAAEPELLPPPREKKR